MVLQVVMKLCLYCPTDIGPLLGSRIHVHLEKEVVPALDSALRMAGGNPDFSCFKFCKFCVVLKSKPLNDESFFKTLF